MSSEAQPQGRLPSGLAVCKRRSVPCQSIPKSRAAYGIGFRVDTSPQNGSCAVTFGYCAENHNGIRQLKENISKNKVFTGSRAQTIRKQSTKWKTISFLLPHESKKLLPGNLLKTKCRGESGLFRADAPYPPLRWPSKVSASLR